MRDVNDILIAKAVVVRLNVLTIGNKNMLEFESTSDFCTLNNSALEIFLSDDASGRCGRKLIVDRHDKFLLEIKRHGRQLCRLFRYDQTVPVQVH